MDMQFSPPYTDSFLPQKKLCRRLLSRMYLPGGC